MAKLFAHRRRATGRTPGEPINEMDSPLGMDKDGPEGYEGREHVKYKNPGYSSHEDTVEEPKMKSRVGKDEMHEMEDNFHMKTPDQTEDTLEKKLKRARMKMDAPNQQEPKKIQGQLVHSVPSKGVEDTSGEELEGPNYMQGSKEDRKKMIVAVTRRKMKKNRE